MRIIAGAAALILLSAGCASSGPPVSNTELAQAEADIRAAENATATEHARDLLDRARGDLAAAQRDWQERRWDDARRHIAETRAAANAAEAKARTVAAEQQAQDMKRQVDDIERRIRNVAPPPKP